ncbi:MAG: hypothetical protein LBV42_05040 [Methanobrevibacter sp.]|nr:hypothetical protein [Methanobrevibacter sp.]
MENFFQELRNIQKKERGNTTSLSRVGDDFYQRVNKQIDKLRHDIENDPYSDEKHDSLKKSVSIITEIYEKREHKIADIAIMNIHRSYHLFTGKPQFDFMDSTPLNLTNEEEKFYFSIINTLKDHRERVSIDVINEIGADDFNQDKNIDNINSKPENYSSDNSEELNKKKNSQDNNLKEDKILNRMEDIKKAKIIKDEKIENITKQIYKSTTNYCTANSINTNFNTKNLKSDPVESKSNIDTNSKNNNINNKKVLNKKITSNNSKENKIEKNSSPSSINKNISNAKHNPLNKDSSLKNKHSNSQNKNNIPSQNLNDENGFKDPNDQFVDLENEEGKYLSDSKKKLKINNKIINKTILLFEDMPSIMGVDTKVHGPFRCQDVAVLPLLNAEIIVKNRKGRFLKI